MHQTIRRAVLSLLACSFLFASPALHADFLESGGLAQNVMTIWTDRGGLPSDTILDGAQDAQGYIWLASYEGLVRFDGESFTVFGARQGFAGRSPRALATASDGTIWIGTNSTGLFSYRGGVFVRYGIEEGLPDLSVRAVAIGTDGAVWAGTARGVAKLVGGKLRAIKGGAAADFGIATFLLPLEGGGILVGSNLPGLWIVDGEELRPYLPGQGLGSYSFSAALIDSASRLWLGTSTGQIFRITRNEVTEHLELPELAGACVNCFLGESDGTVWIGTDRGIARRSDYSFSFFNESNGLPSDVVSSIWRDREGDLWVGTERGGLVKFSPGKFINISERDGLANNSVNGATEDRFGGLWIATDSGVSYFPAGKSSDPAPAPAWTRAAAKLVASLKGARVRQVRADPDGSIWLATYSDKGLILLGAEGRVSSYAKKEGLPTNRVRFSYRTRSGGVWIGTTAGPALLENGTMRAFGVESGLPNLFILSAMEDSKGRVWMGTDGGGLAMLEGGVFRVFTTKDGIAGNVVFRVAEDAKGRLWICSSDGLTLYDGEGFRSADRAAGLSGESVYETLLDSSGKLWIITARKLVVAGADELAAAVANDLYKGEGEDRSAVALRVFDRLDGLAGQFSANAWSYMSSKGILYLPTLQGLSFYNPQSVPLNEMPPPVLVERIEVDGKSFEAPSETIVVPASARRIIFRYTALSYVVPQRVRFEYKLEGFDRTWLAAGADREISYTNLPPGDYSFRVRAENNDGVVNETGATASIRRLPYFYQTIPFYALLALALAGSGFLAALVRVRRHKRREIELGRLVDERTSELALERDKSESLLRNILPQSVAEELKASGRAAPQVYAETTVLFADLVNFTAASTELEPAALIGELNDIFTIFDDVLSTWGCERIKTLGDGYLAVCGAPLALPDHAQRMIGAGLDMLGKLEDRNAAGGRRWELRIGVNSGPIVGGVVGVRKYIFDVFGDTVNTAFRLQSMSVPMGITLSESSARLLDGSRELVPRSLREVKGKGAMRNYYLRYREGFAPLASSAEAASLVDSARDALRVGRIADCVAILGRIDPTLVEPEAFEAMQKLRREVEAK